MHSVHGMPCCRFEACCEPAFAFAFAAGTGTVACGNFELRLKVEV
jgi:hypothetical protein